MMKRPRQRRRKTCKRRRVRMTRCRKQFRCWARRASGAELFARSFFIKPLAAISGGSFFSLNAESNLLLFRSLRILVRPFVIAGVAFPAWLFKRNVQGAAFRTLGLLVDSHTLSVQSGRNRLLEHFERFFGVFWLHTKFDSAHRI